MKKLILFLVILFLSSFLSGLVSANIITHAESFTLDGGEISNKTDIDDYQLKYSFSNGETLTIDSISNLAQLNFEEIYCWSGCNIYPQFEIANEELIKENKIISVQKFDLQNGFEGDINRVIGVLEEEKIDLQKEEVQEVFNLESLKATGDFFVEWNGRLILEENETLNLLLNVSGNSKIILDDQIILDTEGNPSINNSLYNYSIIAGNHTLNITYTSNKVFGKVNILWGINDDSYSFIPMENLFFDSGNVKFFNENSDLRGFKVSSVPESYTIDYSVYPSGVLYIPVELNSNRPLILIHGLHGEYPYWYDIPEQLEGFGNDVYQLYYSDANVSNFMTSGLFKYGIELALEDYTAGTKADIVAHSMGNLVVLGYINGLGKDSDGSDVSYNNDIRSLVMIAGPIHGSYLANRVLRDESAGLICGWFIDPDDPEAQAYYDIAVGSEFSWLISNKSLNSNIRYLSIAGIDDDLACLPFEADNSDSFVSVASASFIDKNVPLAILHANHDNLRGHCWTNLGNRCRWNLFDGFYYDDTMSDLIDGFLDGESNSALESKLYDDEYFITSSTDAQNQGFQEGMSLIKLSSTTTINSVKLKNSSNEFMFVKNPQTDIYYHYNYGEGPFLSCIGSKFGKLNLTLTDMICIGKIGLAIYTGTFDESLVTCLNSNLAKFGITLVTQDVQQCLSEPLDYGLTIPSGNYDLFVNELDTGENVEIKPSQTTLYEFDICSPSLAYTLWSNWENISCLENGLMNQSRFRIQYDSNSCGTFYNQTEYQYKNTESCPIEPTYNLIVNSPTLNVSNDRRILLDLETSEIVDEMVYTYLDSRGREREVRLCRNCDSYNRTRSFSEGWNNLTFKAIMDDEVADEEKASFFIDSTEPRISTTKPSSNKYTNGSDFYIKYTEDNCKSLRVEIHGQQSGGGAAGPCESGRNVERFMQQGLGSFDGQEIEYLFKITDIANNSDESRRIKVKVDTTAPEIKNFSAPIIGRYVYFNMTVLNEDKNSFNKVEYIDGSDSRPAWRSLCTSLKNNNCYKKVSFRTGAHNLIVRATDDAGNSDTEGLSFTIE